jgi:prepilin-type N-terminal cleavage/methylation domain-containing protein
MQGSGSRHGFTLMECVICVLILGIVAMAGIPQFKGMLSEARLNEAAAELVSGLHYSRSLAVEHQRPFGLRVDLSGHWFEVFDSRYRNHPDAHPAAVPPVGANGVVFHPLSKKLYTEDLDAAYDGVQIAAVPAGSEIRFYPDGHSSEAASLFVLQLGDTQRMISVDGTTGKIKAW